MPLSRMLCEKCDDNEAIFIVRFVRMNVPVGHPSSSYLCMSCTAGYSTETDMVDTIDKVQHETEIVECE